MPTSSDQRTTSFYAANAADYVARGLGRADRNLPAFLARLPAHARILELGCGGGHDALAMKAAGFDVDATDGTPAIADQAARLLGCPVRALRFEDLAEQAAYDAVWANASLLHVARAALPQVLRRVFDALRPGGLHFASYKAGTAEGRDSHGRHYNYPDRAGLLAAYAVSAPWQVVDVAEYMGGSFDRPDNVPWLAVTLRRPA